MTTCIINSSSASTTKLTGHDKRYRLSPAFNSRRPTCSIGREFDPHLFLLHRVTIVRCALSHHRGIDRSSIELKKPTCDFAHEKITLRNCSRPRTCTYFFLFILFLKSHIIYFNCSYITKTYFKWEKNSNHCRIILSLLIYALTLAKPQLFSFVNSNT